MRPTRLNLLPPQKQSYLQRMVIVQFIKNTLEALLIVVCLMGVGLLGGQYVLQNHFNQLTESTLGLSAGRSQRNNEIREVNAALRQYTNIYDGYILWTPYLIEIGNAIPEGVVMGSLDFNANGASFQFSGLAATRADLLALEEQLEMLDFISNITIPLSQLTQQENIRFTLIADLAI